MQLLQRNLHRQEITELNVDIFVDFLKWSYPNVLCKYLHSLFTATEQASISELQSFFGTSALLSFILQTAKITLIDCERLKGLLWTQATLLKQINQH